MYKITCASDQLSAHLLENKKYTFIVEKYYIYYEKKLPIYLLITKTNSPLIFFSPANKFLSETIFILVVVS